jgi:hypothetical protein
MPAGDLLYSFTAEELTRHWQAMAVNREGLRDAYLEKVERYEQAAANRPSLDDSCHVMSFRGRADQADQEARAFRLNAERLALPGPWCLTIEQCREEGLI